MEKIFKIKENISFQHWRTRFIVLAIIISFCIVIARSFYLQVITGEKLSKKGELGYSRTVLHSKFRGNIFDRNMFPLATSVPVDSIGIDPTNTNINPYQIEKIERYLDVNLNNLRKNLLTQQRKFLYIKRHISSEQLKVIMNMNISGLSIIKEQKRYYPLGEISAQIIGINDLDGKGIEGSELMYDYLLRGDKEIHHFIKDNAGKTISSFRSKPKNNGEDVQLTIDKRVQTIAFDALKDSVIKNKAKEGSIVVIDATSGELLAVANYPSFNPNNRSTYEYDSIRNKAFTDLFEPGSTMKPFFAAYALDRGVATSHEIYKIGEKIKISGSFINENEKIKTFNYLTLKQVIQKSSQIGAVRIRNSLYDEQGVWNFLTKLGFGKESGLKFPGERIGKLQNYEKWTQSDIASQSFGYGLSTNLLQLTSSYSIFSSGGKLIQVKLSKKDRNKNVRRLIKRNTAIEMTQILASVVSYAGSAPGAKVPGYIVAGKTGTVRIAENGGYNSQKHRGTFIGFAPLENPKLLVGVSINSPEGANYYAGKIAAPVFSDVVSEVFRYMKVPTQIRVDSIETF